jgi:hypothetical protein
MSLVDNALTLFAVLLIGGTANAGITWDFDGTVNPSGAKL